jgi:hypothetical protein
MITPSNYAQLLTDQVSATVTYIGFAQNSFTPTSQPSWCIMRITQASSSVPNGVTLFEFAPEPNVFGAVWDNRTSLTYNA